MARMKHIGAGIVHHTPVGAFNCQAKHTTSALLALLAALMATAAKISQTVGSDRQGCLPMLGDAIKTRLHARTISAGRRANGTSGLVRRSRISFICSDAYILDHARLTRTTRTRAVSNSVIQVDQTLRDNYQNWINPSILKAR